MSSKQNEYPVCLQGRKDCKASYLDEVGKLRYTCLNDTFFTKPCPFYKKQSKWEDMEKWMRRR